MRRPREKLRDQVTDALSSLQEVRGIHLFGREIDGEPDKYSDIDLVCCSADPARTQERYRDALNGISPIKGSYLMIEEPDIVVEMILLEGCSPYQKLDFSLVPDLAKQEAFGPFKTVYESDDRTPVCLSEMKVTGRTADLQNRMNDILFSVPRFTKCLFRHDFDMYRRWTGIVAWMHVLLYERHFGWLAAPRSKLRPFEYKALYKALEEQERKHLEGIQPLNGIPDVVTGFQRSIDLFITLYREKAKHFNIQLDSVFVDYMKAFLDSEVERFVQGDRGVYACGDKTYSQPQNQAGLTRSPES